MRVRDAAVVITGAGSGIGRASALAFADAGALLVLAGRRGHTLAELARECEARGGEALPVEVDVTDPAAVEQLAQRAVQRFGRIDVWVNNAAVTMFAPFAQMPLADLRRVIEVNVVGCVHGARSALRQVRAQGSGVLINVSSVVGRIAQPYTSAYSMSKAAVRSLSVSLRQELLLDGVRGVKVCTVLPATADTPIYRQTANYTGRAAEPMPPVYSPQRVARTIVNLVRLPRREVVSGPLGRLLLLAHGLAPGLTERIFARQVDRRHLSRTRPAAATSGTLYEPAADPRTDEVAGGWGGRRRTIVRTATAATVGVAGAAVLRRAMQGAR